jgi:hypothetical protein
MLIGPRRGETGVAEFDGVGPAGLDPGAKRLESRHAVGNILDAHEAVAKHPDSAIAKAHQPHRLARRGKGGEWRPFARARRHALEICAEGGGILRPGGLSADEPGGGEGEGNRRGHAGSYHRSGNQHL